MDSKALNSSSIADIGYEEGTRTLRITFKNGSVYQYLGVPALLREEFMGCASKGRFFNDNIRDSYEYVRIK